MEDDLPGKLLSLGLDSYRSGHGPPTSLAPQFFIATFLETSTSQTHSGVFLTIKLKLLIIPFIPLPSNLPPMFMLKGNDI